MPILTIYIDMDGAAFTERQGMEVGRILALLADTAATEGVEAIPKVIHDYNGNRVGTALCDEEVE